MTQLVEAIVYKPMQEVAIDAACRSHCIQANARDCALDAACISHYISQRKRLHLTQLVEANLYKSMQEVALDAACRSHCI
jgi:hypothetical protein